MAPSFRTGEQVTNLPQWDGSILTVVQIQAITRSDVTYIVEDEKGRTRVYSDYDLCRV